MTWTGADSGYEGTFGPNSGPLYAIAVERGVVTPPDPEWWPAAAQAGTVHERASQGAVERSRPSMQQ